MFFRGDSSLSRGGGLGPWLGLGAALLIAVAVGLWWTGRSGSPPSVPPAEPTSVRPTSEPAASPVGANRTLSGMPPTPAGSQASGGQAVAPLSASPKPAIAAATPPASQAQLDARAASILTGPSAGPELKAMPIAPAATNVESDNTHLLMYRVTQAPDEVINWYAGKLRQDGYQVQVGSMPAQVSVRVLSFTTPGGRKGGVTVTATDQRGSTSQVQVLIQ